MAAVAMAMRIEEPPVGERPLKRQRMLHDRAASEPCNGSSTYFAQIPPDTSKSAFVLAPVPQGISNEEEFIIDIGRYIPAGCLRISSSDCSISANVWGTQSSWAAVSSPQDAYNTKAHNLLLNAFQERLVRSRVIVPYESLLNAGLVRMEFKANDSLSGQFRVYILPDNFAPATAGRERRSIHKAVKLLLSQLDISGDTWKGIWQKDDPVRHINPSLDKVTGGPGQESLLSLFNAVPSPVPCPDLVRNVYARDSIRRILANDVHGIKTALHSYQRKSAAFMLQREAEPGLVIDPRLYHLVDHSGIPWYCDPYMGLICRDPIRYESAKGGILAENMGLGKTLICLSVILASRDIPSQVPAEHSMGLLPVRKVTGSLLEMAASTTGRTSTPWKTDIAMLESDGYEFSRVVDALRRNQGFYNLSKPEPSRLSRHTVSHSQKIWLSTSTIVVVPANLIQQWCAEIRKHTEGLKVLVMKHAKEELPLAERLIDYDLILFSKLRFDKEARDILDEEARINYPRRRVGSCTCSDICICRRSPLKDIHFKRLIYDEGHTLGNSSNTSQTHAFTVVNSLQITARWVVSGTPTQGLYGVEDAVSDTPMDFTGCIEGVNPAGSSSTSPTDSPSQATSQSKQDTFSYQQERNDLVKLGNIATSYLRSRPWASSSDGDVAIWAHYVMQPRHGAKSHGSVQCLKATLASLMIRHRPEDIIVDVSLPPLYQTDVYLDGCILDKLALNAFSMMVITNAVTSERKDVDYFFHPTQRKHLQDLVSNMRRASFFWSGWNIPHIVSTIENAKSFLEKAELPLTAEDNSLLQQVLEHGDAIINNGIFKLISTWHEMPMLIQNDCPAEVRVALSLDDSPHTPTLAGATTINDAQKFVECQLWKENPMDGLAAAINSHLVLRQRLETSPSSTKSSRRKRDTAPPLAGGVSVGDDLGHKRVQATFSTSSEILNSPIRPKVTRFSISDSPQKIAATENREGPERPVMLPSSSGLRLKSALKPYKPDKPGTLDPASPLNSAVVISTASSKLSYLMDKISLHQAEEKILIFYESDTNAYYIAQALECLNIQHLIYAKSLTPELRSRYVAAFNTTETFRVLLMDVSQAAFGLDISSASRVFFVNPVFSPQVEAQALKRAHRIGQTKPVYVETLVMKGSIEEVIVKHRKDLSSEEHNKCKSLLDDQTMFHWIRNIKFLPIPAGPISDPDQLAKLERPQKLFGTGAGSQKKVELVSAELAPAARRSGQLDLVSP